MNFRIFPNLLSVLIVLFTIQTQAQNKIQSGPMPVDSQMREVTIWLQTAKKSEVQIRYWIKGDTSKIYKTKKYKTKREKAFTAHMKADMVEPGHTYEYEIFVDNKVQKIEYPLFFESQVLWQYRSDPPNFSFITGSCSFINEKEYDRSGKPYGGEYHIYETMSKSDANFMLWLGDNVYFREADYYSRTGMIKRYNYDRSQKFMQPLLSSMHHYAIWDDHDYGPNDSDGSFVLKKDAQKVFEMFWGNPKYGVNGLDGITTMFKWADVDFFLMDNRYHRSAKGRKTGKIQMFGDEQLDWLINALKFSDAPFKIIVIGSQVLSSAMVKDNFSNFVEEKKYLLDTIQEEGIEGVLFITGDRHFTELSKVDREGTYPLYDFTISPITSGPSSDRGVINKYRVEGSYYTERNFAKFDFSGSIGNRILKCEIFDANGNSIWVKEIKESELK